MVKQFIIFIGILILLIGCGQENPSSSENRNLRLVTNATLSLPTAAPPTELLPTNTLVMAEPWTATPVFTPTPIPTEVLGLVTEILTTETVAVILQGDNLNKAYVVRLLGVDAPQNGNASAWGRVAFETLNEWLNGKIVRIVQDKTVINEDGELPRYLYQDDILINKQMIELGLANTIFNNPDIAFRAEFEQASRTAQTNKRGIWGPPPTSTTTPSFDDFTATPTLIPPTVTPIPTQLVITTTATLTATE